MDSKGSRHGIQKVVLDIYVLDPWWVNCQSIGQSEHSTVVFEHLILDCWLGASNRYPLILELLYEVHDRYDLVQSLTKADVLSLTCGQDNFSLE
jgi:hypothetical protein